MGTEEKRGIKNDFWAFYWNHQMIRSAKLREGERWQEDSKKVRDGRRGGFQIVGLG